MTANSAPADLNVGIVPVATEEETAAIIAAVQAALWRRQLTKAKPPTPPISRWSQAGRQSATQPFSRDDGTR